MTALLGVYVATGQIFFKDLTFNILSTVVKSPIFQEATELDNIYLDAVAVIETENNEFYIWPLLKTLQDIEDTSVTFLILFKNIKNMYMSKKNLEILEKQLIH